jgi:hypothetical protein
MATKEDPVKYWADIRQCISDVNRSIASLQLALAGASASNNDDFVTIALTKRQIAMVLVLLEGAFK